MDSVGRHLVFQIPSLKLTFSHLKTDGWKTIVLLGWPIFRGELLVSGRVHLWDMAAVTTQLINLQ